MMFVDEVIDAIHIAMHPAATTKKSMDIKSALRFYYRHSVILGVLAIIFTIMGALVAPPPVATATATLQQATISRDVSIVVNLLEPWVFIPIGLVIDAAIFHAIGRIVGKFKQMYANTMSAFTYAAMPNLLLLWLSTMLGLSGPAAAYYAITIIVAVWNVIVLVFALSSQQRVSRLAAFGVWLLTVVIIVAIVVALVIASGAAGRIAPA